MKLLIAGGRDFNNYPLLVERVNFLLNSKKPEAIICGMAKGADLLGHMYAVQHGIPILEYPADWSIGKHAGYLRNRDMGHECSHGIVFWDGESKGSKHMIDILKELNKPYRIVRY